MGVSERELRELPIAAPVLGSQPGRHTLKGVETNVYAEAAEQSFRITVLGRGVEVRVRPVEFRFDYGDGSLLASAAPGGPIHQERWGERTATSHPYTGTGDYTLSLTTVFAGEFRLEGGPWQPIAGTSEIPSRSRALSVWRSEVRLYADDCIANPAGEGC